MFGSKKAPAKVSADGFVLGSIHSLIGSCCVAVVLTAQDPKADTKSPPKPAAQPCLSLDCAAPRTRGVFCDKCYAQAVKNNAPHL